MLSIDAPGPALAPPPASFNMAQHVLAAGLSHPDKLALRIAGATDVQDWTYGEITRAVRGIAAGLRAQDVVEGDLVLLRLGNTVEFPLAFLGAIAAGLVPVPTAATLTRLEISKMAADISPALIIASDGIELPAPLRCPVIHEGDLHSYAKAAPAPFQMGAPERPGYAVYTSGTSGRPRAVLHAHRAIWARQMMWDGWYGLRPDDRLLHAGAFNWTYTLGTGLLDPWTRGASAIIPAPGTKNEALPALLAHHDATIFAAVPGVYRQMLRADMPAMPALRHGLSAGEKLAAPIRNAWHNATNTQIYEAFGMSECSTFVSASPSRPAPDGALGFAQPGRKIAVVDDSDESTPIQARGEAGVLAVDANDPGLTLGYIGHPDETAKRFRAGWFLTGDRVTMDEAGAITYLGREDDMMNAGGFRVSPLEVEAAMSSHDSVIEAAAVELPVKETASVIALFYVAAASGADETQLEAHAKNTLADYKRPRMFIALESLPRGANNKLLRRALLDQWRATQDS
ncbi:MAG: class I adenylate-forming enzyme family protein [Maritimibacter sp.]